MVTQEQHNEELKQICAEVNKLVQLRNAKVIRDLRELADDIEAGNTDVEEYNYSFRLKNEVDYGEYESGNEIINVEFTRAR